MSQTTQGRPSSTRPARKAGAAGTSVASPPSPPRRRRPALTALAVLLIVGGAALAGTLALRMDSREPVLVFNADVPVGTQISSGMFAKTDVASDGLRLVGVDSLKEVEGLYLRQSAYAGQLLDLSMLSKKSPIGGNRAQVGIPLSSGKVPPGLRVGDEVTLMSIGDDREAGTVLCTALVIDVDQGDDGGSLSTSDSSSVATVLVPRAASTAVVSAAGNDTLGVALLQRGVSLDNASIVMGGVG